MRRGINRRGEGEPVGAVAAPPAQVYACTMSSTLGGYMGRSRKDRSGLWPRRQAIFRNGAGVRLAVVALIGLSTLAAVLTLIFRFSVEAATLRATIGTTLVLSGLTSAWFIWVRSTRTRQVSDLLLLVAVLTLTSAQFVFFAAPAIADSHSPDRDAAIPLIAHLEAAGMFAAAALARRRLVSTRRQATALLATPILGAAAVAVGALLIYGESAWYGPDAHPGLTTTAQAVALTVPGAFLMLVAAIGFVRRSLRQRDMSIGLLGAAAILLAAAWSHSLLVSRVTANSVSGHDCLCVAASGLILLVAFSSHTQLKRAQADEATAAERRRLVCELHDGMAQDLAFIATYAEHLVQDFGPEHPLTVAARRALAASRGVIVDLSASDARNAASALRTVADELSTRHGVRITVEADGEALTTRIREAVVGIAREAIVNAIQHGQAQHISVSLETRNDTLTLRISDDGRGLRKGISVDQNRGFGIRAMRERAAAIGGDLIVDERNDGGVTVEAVVT